MHEAAQVYRWSWWQRFFQMELPYSAIGLIWNSMMSVAGGWFFLIACEMFVLGDRDLRLPGLGSYLQTAANEGNTRAIFWGLAVMIGVIVLIDQLIWRPVIAWAQKFKFEQVESTDEAALAGPRFPAALEDSAADRRSFHSSRARAPRFVFRAPPGLRRNRAAVERRLQMDRARDPRGACSSASPTRSYA